MSTRETTTSGEHTRADQVGYVQPRYPETMISERGPLTLDNKVMLVGTVGEWQGHAKVTLAGEDVDPRQHAVDPQKPEGTHYTLDDTRSEISELATDRFILMNIGGNNGFMSGIESGTMALHLLAGAREGARGYLRMEELPDGGDTRSQRMRALITHAASRISETVGPDVLTLSLDQPHSDTLEDDAAVQEWLKGAAADIKAPPTEAITLPERPAAKPLLKRVYVSGSAVPAADSPVKGIFVRELSDLVGDKAVMDSYDDDGDFSAADMAKEYEERDKSAVIAHVITADDPEGSRGAIAETVWLATLAHLNGQKFLLHIQGSDDELRQRLRLHIDAIRESYPDLIQTAETPEQLAQIAAQELEAFEAVEKPIRDVQANLEWLETAERGEITDRMLRAAQAAYEQHGDFAITPKGMPWRRTLRLYGASRGDKLVIDERTRTLPFSTQEHTTFELQDSTTHSDQWVDLTDGRSTGTPYLFSHRRHTLRETLSPSATLAGAANMSPLRDGDPQEIAHMLYLLEHGSPVRPEFSLRAHGRALMGMVNRVLSPFRRSTASSEDTEQTDSQPGQTQPAERQKPRESAPRRNLRFLRGVLRAARTDIDNGRRDGFERNK